MKFLLLRQPVLLTDGQGVIATMPLEGVLHPRNALDTLGADEAEKTMQAQDLNVQTQTATHEQFIMNSPP